jgi:rod shape-determining protein MreB
LAADIVDKGIVLVGGGALLKNLDILLREVTSLPITIADDPLSSIVLGAGMVLDNEQLLRTVTVQYR